MDKKANRQRNIGKYFCVNELENQIIEVNRIGNNLNQIAKHLNESEQNQTKELLNEYQNEIQSLDQKLRNMLKKITEG